MDPRIIVRSAYYFGGGGGVSDSSVFMHEIVTRQSLLAVKIKLVPPRFPALMHSSAVKITDGIHSFEEREEGIKVLRTFDC